MKVVKITAHPVRYPEPHDHGRTRHLCLVRAEAEDGTVGWGEAITMWPEASQATKIIVETGLAPLVLALPELDVGAAWQAMRKHLWWYGPEGIGAFALSAIDIALWDLKGKLLGKPVWDLLGGLKQPKVRPAASIHLNMDDEEWSLNEFKTFRDMGYTVVKGGWGTRPENVWGGNFARDIRFAEKSRRIIGDDCGLVFDALCARNGWDLKKALRYCEALLPYNLEWLEEPLHPQDLDSHRRLREMTRMRIGTGEQEWTPDGYRRIVRYGAADVIQMDPARCLGISGNWMAIQLCEQERIPFFLHTWSSAMCVAAGVHLLAASSMGFGMDFKPRFAPITQGIADGAPEAVDGFITPSREPGLGLRVKDEAVAQYQW